MEDKTVVGEVKTSSQYQRISERIRCAVQTIEAGVLKRITQRVKAVKINRGQCSDLVLTFSSGVSGSFKLVKEVLELLDDPETRQSASEVTTESANILESSTSQIRYKASRRRIQELCLYSLADLDRCLEMGEVYQSHCLHVQFWRTALRMSIIAPNTASEVSHTNLSCIFREFAWSVDVVRLAFTAFKVLLLTGMDLLQQDVSFEWCARRGRLVLNRIGESNFPQENHSVLQSSSVKDSDEKELLRMLKEIAGESLWLPSAYQKHRSKIASFLTQKMEGPAPRTDYLPTTFKIDYRDILLKTFLDDGSYSSVAACEWQGEMVAVKCLKGCNPEARKRILDKEVTLLASVQHPNIVQLIGYAYEEKASTGMIVMELMPMNLRNLIDHNLHQNCVKEGTVPTFHDDSTPFPLDVTIHILLQIAEAMCHLRGLRVMHRDLKAVNILVNQCDHGRSVPSESRCNLQSERESFYQVKLADFGTSKSQPLVSKFRTKAGTRCWMAPEVLAVESNSEHNSSEYTWSADVYSFGITCSEVLTGLLPFQDISTADLLSKIRTDHERPPLPRDCPAPLRKMISDCWATDPKCRPAFVEIWETLWLCRLKILLNDGKLSMKQNFQVKLRAITCTESQGLGDGLRHAFSASLFQTFSAFGLKEETTEDFLKAAMGDAGVFYTYSELQEATKDFHPSMELFKGFMETSYEGVQPDGKRIVVQRLLIKPSQKPRELIAKVVLLSKVKHINLVQFTGCCLTQDGLLLVYGYVGDKTLAKILLDCRLGDIAVDWGVRYNMCLGIAAGLVSLHQAFGTHGGWFLNDNNILLDSHMNAKLNVGLAYFFPDYLAAEMRKDNSRIRFTEQSDVLNFGFLLNDIVSGSRVPGVQKWWGALTFEPNQSPGLARLWEDKCSLLECVDPTLNIQGHEEEVLRVLRVALCCMRACLSGSCKQLGHSMQEVHSMLSGKTPNCYLNCGW